MALIARIIGLALLTAAMGAGLGSALFSQDHDRSFASLVLGCVGGVIGAIAGAAREIVAAQRENPSS